MTRAPTHMSLRLLLELRTHLEAKHSSTLALHKTDHAVLPRTIAAHPPARTWRTKQERVQSSAWLLIRLIDNAHTNSALHSHNSHSKPADDPCSPTTFAMAGENHHDSHDGDTYQPLLSIEGAQLTESIYLESMRSNAAAAPPAHRTPRHVAAVAHLLFRPVCCFSLCARADASAAQAPAATMTTVLVTSPPPPPPPQQQQQQQAADAAEYPPQSQQQHRVSASILDLRALPAVGSTVLVATGVPIDPLAAGPAGQLFFLPDLPDAVRMWHAQRLLMVVWLISSLASLILFAPLVMASGLFLAAEVAAVCGLVAATVHLCERQLAASNSE